MWRSSISSSLTRDFRELVRKRASREGSQQHVDIVAPGVIVLGMERVNGTLRLSATDLVGHLNCGHLTHLDLAVANGELARPRVWDPLLEILWERGTRHEQGFVDHLTSLGLGV